MTKKCTKCGEELDISQFNKKTGVKDGHRNSCRTCSSLSNKKYYTSNKAEILETHKQYYQDNPEYFKQYRIQNKEHLVELDAKNYAKNRDDILIQKKRYYEDNRDKIKANYNNPRVNAYKKTRRLTDEAYKLQCNLRRRTRDAIKNQRGKKAYKTIELLGCTIQECRAHLESQFTQGMSWDNYGDWHIDHIKPCASFDLTDPIQQKACFNYTNLQPLWAEDNLKKSNKLI